MKVYCISKLQFLIIFLFTTIDVVNMSCQKETNFFNDSAASGVTLLTPNNQTQPAAALPFEFPSPVYDIAATPSGSILVALKNFS
jgi:hypothetical protein